MEQLETPNTSETHAITAAGQRTPNQRIDADVVRFGARHRTMNTGPPVSPYGDPELMKRLLAAATPVRWLDLTAATIRYSIVL